MQNGFLDIQIAGAEFATVSEIVSFEPNDSDVQLFPIFGYGAAAKQFVSLGNISVKGGFTMTKYWDNAEDAWAHFMGAAGTFNGVNNMLVTKTCVDGTLVAWLFSGCTIKVKVEEPLNMTTTTHVMFEGPAPALQP